MWREFEAVSILWHQAGEQIKAIRSSARSGSASALSTLFSTTIGPQGPSFSAWEVTTFGLWRIGPSAGHIDDRTTPSTIDKDAFTRPPKSA